MPLDADQKMKLAYRHVLTRNKFFGARLVRLRMVRDPGVKTAVTDGRVIRWNPKFVAGLTIQETVGLLVHEIMHVVNGHHLRRRGRDPHRWNVAGDFVINSILLNQKFTLPAGALVSDEFKEQATEVVYSIIEERYKKKPEPEPAEEEDDEEEDEQPATCGEQEAGEEENEEDGNPGSGPTEEDPSESSEDASEDEGGAEREPPDDSSEEDEDEAGADDGGNGSGGGGSDPDDGDDPFGEMEDEDDIDVDVDVDDDDDYDYDDGEEDFPLEDTRPELPDTWGDVEDMKNEDGTPLEQDEIKHAEEKLQRDLMQDVYSAKRAGELPAGILRIVEEVTVPVVNWRSLLRRYVQELVPTDTSWSRPNRRFVSQGVYLPGPGEPGITEVVIAIDNSGSIQKKDLDNFQAEVRSLLAEIMPDKVIVVCCDSAVNRYEEYTGGYEQVDLTSNGGGGTQFEPVIKKLEEEGVSPRFVLWFTDLYPMGWPPEPDYPIVWVTWPPRYKAYRPPVPPYGEVVQMQAED